MEQYWALSNQAIIYMVAATIIYCFGRAIVEVEPFAEVKDPRGRMISKGLILAGYALVISAFGLMLWAGVLLLRLGGQLW